MVDVASVGIAFLGVVAFVVHFDATDDSDEMGPSFGNTGSKIGLTVLGVVMAMVIDDAALAKRAVPSGGSVAPYAAPAAGGGVTLGVAGAF